MERLTETHTETAFAVSSTSQYSEYTVTPENKRVRKSREYHRPKFHHLEPGTLVVGLHAYKPSEVGQLSTAISDPDANELVADGGFVENGTQMQTIRVTAANSEERMKEVADIGGKVNIFLREDRACGSTVYIVFDRDTGRVLADQSTLNAGDLLTNSGKRAEITMQEVDGRLAITDVATFTPVNDDQAGIFITKI